MGATVLIVSECDDVIFSSVSIFFYVTSVSRSDVSSAGGRAQKDNLVRVNRTTYDGVTVVCAHLQVRLLENDVLSHVDAQKVVDCLIATSTNSVPSHDIQYTPRAVDRRHVCLPIHTKSKHVQLVAYDLFATVEAFQIIEFVALKRGAGFFLHRVPFLLGHNEVVFD